MYELLGTAVLQYIAHLGGKASYMLHVCLKFVNEQATVIIILFGMQVVILVYNINTMYSFLYLYKRTGIDHCVAYTRLM